MRDLWPDSIMAVGAIRNKLVLNSLSSIEHFLYKRADGIVGVAESVRAVIASRSGRHPKIAIIPNGVDADFFAAAEGVLHRNSWISSRIGDSS